MLIPESSLMPAIQLVGQLLVCLALMVLAFVFTGACAMVFCCFILHRPHPAVCRCREPINDLQIQDRE